MSDIEDMLIGSSDIRICFILKSIESIIYRSGRIIPFKDPFLFGRWWGNETIGDMIADINRIILYCDKFGYIHDNKQRRVFNLVDAVIAGEGEGPLRPSPKRIGYLLSGLNPVAVDMVGCQIIGYDPQKISALRAAFETKSSIYKLIDFDEAYILVKINDNPPENLSEASRKLNFKFIPPLGWETALRKEL